MNNLTFGHPQHQTYSPHVSALSNLSKVPPLSVFQRLHWGEGAVLTVHRKVNGDWQDLGAIKASELYAKWPLVAAHVSHDSYFSISSTHQQGKFWRISEVSGLPIYSRKAECLRWLNAIILDLDLYKTHGRFGLDEMLHVFAAEIDRNELPQPSLICSSGRGLWGLWLLRDHSNQTPVPAFPERREIYERVNRELVKRFSHLGADPAAVDPSRVMRVPGSINTDAAPECNVVQFFKLSNESHTLPALADSLGMKGRKVRLSVEPRRPKNEAKVAAARTRWSVPLQGFRRLWIIRGHFDHGVRSYATYIYAALLRNNRIPECEIYSECSRLADSCRPILPMRKVCCCVSSSLKCVSGDWKRSISNAAIARLLNITPLEKAMLQPWFKPDRHKKVDQIAARHSLIVSELQQAGCWASERQAWTPTREMVRLLFDKHGIQGKAGRPLSHVTVATDYCMLHRRHFAECSSVKFPVPAASLSLSVPATKN